MKNRLVMAAVAAAALGLAVSAQAETLLFSYVEAGGIEFSFDQSSTPTPIAFDAGSDTFVAITNFSGNIGPFTSIDWYNLAASGMFNTPDNAYEVFGPQVYTGLESNPTFAPGVFDGADQTNGLDGVLTVTVASVPEPATWALMIIGAGIMGAGLRASRKFAATA